MRRVTSDNRLARAPVQSFLIACGILGSVVFTVTYLVDGALHHGYNPMYQPISSLELVTNGWVQQANFLVLAVFVIGFGAGMRQELRGGSGGTLFPLLQVPIAIGLLISGVFIRDPLHTTGDYITFLAIVASFVVMAFRFAREPQWRGWTAYSIVSALLMIFLLAMFGRNLHSGGPAGLFERLATGVRQVWEVILAARLLLSEARFRPASLSAAQPIPKPR
jgi:hypothetical protein